MITSAPEYRARPNDRQELERGQKIKAMTQQAQRPPTNVRLGPGSGGCRPRRGRHLEVLARLRRCWLVLAWHGLQRSFGRIDRRAALLPLRGRRGSSAGGGHYTESRGSRLLRRIGKAWRKRLIRTADLLAANFVGAAADKLRDTISQQEAGLCQRFVERGTAFKPCSIRLKVRRWSCVMPRIFKSSYSMAIK